MGAQGTETAIAVRDDMEIAEVEQERGLTLTEKIISMIPEAGNVELPAEKLEALFAPVDESQVEIRPDGLIYLPWVYYATRLNEAFGVGWVMIPDGKPKMEDTLILWPFYLVVRGKLMGYAIGEQEYQTTNRTMSYGDAIEGAKSNALMRICKSLGIGLELWQPTFINAWKAKYAASEWRVVKGKNKQVWFKKGAIVQDDKKQETDLPDTEQPQPTRQPEDAGVLLKNVHAYAADMAITHQQLHDWMIKQWPEYESLADLPAAGLLKMRSCLEKRAKDDIQDDHLALIIRLANDAGFASTDTEKFKKYAKRILTFEPKDIGRLTGFQGIALVKALKEAIKAIHEAEEAQADEDQ